MRLLYLFFAFALIFLPACQSGGQSSASIYSSATELSTNPLVLSAAFLMVNDKCMLHIELLNTSDLPIQVPELAGYTLILHDSSGNCVGLGAMNARIEKVVTLQPHESISKDYDWSDSKIPDGDLYLTHHRHRTNIDYTPLKSKVANKSLNRTAGTWRKGGGGQGRLLWGYRAAG